jgi:hypothetical protein
MFMHKLEHLQIESQCQGHQTSLQEYIINLVVMGDTTSIDSIRYRLLFRKSIEVSITQTITTTSIVFQNFPPL